jgi:hypothetical protein
MRSTTYVRYRSEVYFFLVRKDAHSSPQQTLRFVHSKGRPSIAGIFWGARWEILYVDNTIVLPAIIWLRSKMADEGLSGAYLASHKRRQWPNVYVFFHQSVP